ncbi:MAG: hypothetical protein GY892_07590 [Shimia sp.]|nr:hypothetical protein [Shimia sp.]
MAEYKNKYLTNEETGQLFVVGQNGDPVPIQPQDIAELEAGSVSQFFSAAERGLGTIATGAGSLMGLEGTRESFNELERQGEVQGAVNRIQQLGQYAPDVVAGVATGGGSLTATAGKAALVEGMLGAARNPDAPVQGAIQQGAIGAATTLTGGVLAPVVVGGIRVGTQAGNKLAQRFNSVADDVIERSRVRADSINAARNASPEYSTQGRILAGQNTVEQMDELALDFGYNKGDLYTTGMARQLRATTDAEDAAATALREQEELFASNVLLDRTGGGGKSINKVQDNLKDVSTKVVMRELGENLESRMTWQNMRRIEEEIVQPFKDAQAKAGPIKIEADDVVELNDIKLKAEANDERLVTKYIDDIEADVAKEGGKLTPQDAQQLRTRLGNDIMQASKRGQAERAGSLADLRDVLDNAMERNLDGETLEALTEARQKYRVLKTVQRSAATIDPSGKININSFIKAWQRSGNNRYGRTSKGFDEFNRNLETLNNLGSKMTPSSGTAQRLIAGAASGPVAAVGAAAIGGAGLLGQ